MTVTDAITSLRAAFLPRYAVERELGRGGMATVYLAEDLVLHRRVALKVLHAELAASLGRERFLREIEIAARFTHPHILALHDSGEADGRLFYAMPYVEGESLRQRLTRESQLAVADAIEILRAVASALTHAHRQGVVHRDIKPENILLAAGGSGAGVHPLVADFGIARALDVAGGERLTETGLALGTPSYMSPEQSAGSSRVDGRSDIYALGCVGYEMLAGTPPFTGKTTQAIMARHAVDPVPPLHTVRATVPPAVEAAIERALAKVPADRFTTAAEFGDALVAEAVTLPLLGRRLARRHARPVVGVALGAAALAIGAWYLRGSPASPAVLPSAAKIAVLPLVAATQDTSLARLGQDLAVTVSASLDGVGGIETADRIRVANATAERPGLSPSEGAELARRLGAGSLLRGTLVRAGDNVRLDLVLYSSAGLAPLAGGITVTGHRDSIGALTDSVTWSLLRQIWQRGEPPSPSLAAVSTRSLPALRAFLEGERELGLNRWGPAKTAFHAAVTADSSFSLAYFRYALTRWWTHESLEPEFVDALKAHRDALTRREQSLLDAFLTSGNTPGVKVERHRAVTREFPDYWPAWFLLADALHHGGPVAGYDWREAPAAFRRVLAINPKLVPPWEHIFRQSLGKDTAAVTEAYQHLVPLGWPAGEPLVARIFNRFDAAVSSTWGVITPQLSPLADSLAELIVHSDDEFVRLQAGPLWKLQQGYPATQLDLNRRALRVRPLPAQTARAYRAADAWVWAARGRWDSALATMSAVVAEGQELPGINPPLVVQDYGLAVLGAVLGAVDPALAAQRRAAVAGSLDRLTDQEARRFARARLAWTDGLLGFARRDRGAIRRARADLRGNDGFQDNLVDRSLAALEHALAGDRRRAGRALADLEDYCVAHEDCGSVVPHIAIQRFLAGQWLAETGEVERAARLLRWQDGDWYDWSWLYGDALGGPAFLVRARLEEGRADTARAREYYRQFLRRYDQPVPSQAHLVEEARSALARLAGDPDVGPGR
jgi:tRNA A-37 threonylcarbamoyl transferase component Bud32